MQTGPEMSKLESFFCIMEECENPFISKKEPQSHVASIKEI